MENVGMIGLVDFHHTNQPKGPSHERKRPWYPWVEVREVGQTEARSQKDSERKDVESGIRGTKVMQ